MPGVIPAPAPAVASAAVDDDNESCIEGMERKRWCVHGSAQTLGRCSLPNPLENPATIIMIVSHAHFVNTDT